MRVTILATAALAAVIVLPVDGASAHKGHGRHAHGVSTHKHQRHVQTNRGFVRKHHRHAHSARSAARKHRSHRVARAATRPQHRAQSGTSLSGVVPALAAKAREIVQVCGSRVVSSVRHTNIAGTGRASLHSFGKAVDLQGNPRCIYAHVRSWAGGVSTDYGRVNHVHLSYDPQGRREWGLRFAHGGGRSARRYARYDSQGLQEWGARAAYGGRSARRYARLVAPAWPTARTD